MTSGASDATRARGRLTTRARAAWRRMWASRLPWKVYGWGLFVATAAGFVLAAVLGWRLAHWVDLPISAISVAGVLSYAHRVRLLGPRFWGWWLAFVVLWDLLIHSGAVPALSVSGGEGPSAERILRGLLLYGLGLPIVLPAYAALYLRASEGEPAPRG